MKIEIEIRSNKEQLSSEEYMGIVYAKACWYAGIVVGCGLLFLGATFIATLIWPELAQK